MVGTYQAQSLGPFVPGSVRRLARRNCTFPKLSNAHESILQPEQTRVTAGEGVLVTLLASWGKSAPEQKQNFGLESGTE